MNCALLPIETSKFNSNGMRTLCHRYERRTDKMAKNEKERANNCIFIAKKEIAKKRERERESSKKSGTGFCYQKIAMHLV